MRVDRKSLLKEVKDLLVSVNQGTMSSSAYDTAWLARLPGNTPGQPLAFPSCVSWLLAHQLPDGSWGSQVETLHDRCLSTLNAAVTLAELAEKNLLDSGEARLRVSNAVAYLWRRAKALKEDAYETVGFELLFPPLLERARQLNLRLPYEDFQWVSEVRTQKLQLVPTELRYSPNTTLVHSLEYLADEVDVNRLGALQAANGSFGNSPAATAYALTLRWNERAHNYLRQAVSAAGDGGVGNVYPFEIFEKAWVLESIQAAGIDMPEMRTHLEDLHSCWGPHGIGISAEGLACDSDDTALTGKVLHAAGYVVNPDVFRYYEGPVGYLCFPFERNPSVSANVHILSMLKVHPASQQSAIKHILAFLKDVRRDGAYWQDKWHVSPYYATGHAILALRGLAKPLVQGAVNWLLNTQLPDGSWGVFGGSCEETAYAVQALVGVGGLGSPRVGPAIDRGIEFLLHIRDTEKHPELWVGKGLYAPTAVIDATVLSALLQYTPQRKMVGA